MKVIAFGGDARMDGAVLAARKSGWDAQHVRSAEEMEAAGAADVVLLPWPHSFTDGMLTGTQTGREKALSAIPDCRLIAYGSGVTGQELPMAALRFDPGHDEAFLRANAQLTAEGAIARAMQREGRALLDATVMITGFGRIAQALAARLTALGAFVIVCARSEKQMQRAHALGAHPMAFSRIAQAAAQAEILFNTVPAQVLCGEVLAALGRQALIIDLAGAPYGVNEVDAQALGARYVRMSGVPGRYAALDAGAALFDAAQRALCDMMEKGGQDDG